MTSLPNSHLRRHAEVLLAYRPRGEAARMLGGMDDVIRPAGVVLCRTHTGYATIRRVERGGLAGAIVCGEAPQMDGLSLLRIIRSIDGRLPCWLVTRDITRQTLETALALRVSSVMTLPVEVGELTLILRKALGDPLTRN